MKILILGGTGLISTQLTQQLLARGAEVWHFNRGQRAAGFGGVQFHRPVRAVQGDRKDAAAFEAHMRKLPMFDCVLDMIGFAPEDAESDVRAFAGRCAHLVFCSTVDVYAHPQPNALLPYREDAPQHGGNKYAADKVACERVLPHAHGRGELNVTIIRPAATYAEGGGILDSLRGRSTYVDRLRKGKPDHFEDDLIAAWEHGLVTMKEHWAKMLAHHG